MKKKKNSLLQKNNVYIKRKFLKQRKLLMYMYLYLQKKRIQICSYTSIEAYIKMLRIQQHKNS